MPNFKPSGHSTFLSDSLCLPKILRNQLTEFRRDFSHMLNLQSRTIEREALLVSYAVRFCNSARSHMEEYLEFCDLTNFNFRDDDNPDGQIARHLLQFCGKGIAIKPYFATCFASIVRSAVSERLNEAQVTELLIEAGSIQSWYRTSAKNKARGRPKFTKESTDVSTHVDVDGVTKSSSSDLEGGCKAILDARDEDPKISDFQPKSKTSQSTLNVSDSSKRARQREIFAASLCDLISTAGLTLAPLRALTLSPALECDETLAQLASDMEDAINTLRKSAVYRDWNLTTFLSAMLVLEVSKDVD